MTVDQLQRPALRDTSTVVPRWATPRTPGRRSYGAAIAKVAAAYGKPLQPWQRMIADVATELLPDGTWAYRTVTIGVQRQAGKTTLIGPVNLHRCLTRMRARAWFTAQTRQDARDSWRDVAELVTGPTSPLAAAFSVRRSNGSEELLANPTGSTFRVFAPSEDALHGKANEIVTVDEGWAQDAASGAALLQAITPTFSTTGGQLWLPSTAGTSASTWLRGFVDRGRAAVESGETTGRAHFEFGLAPAAADEVATVLSELARVGYKLDDQLSHALDRVVDLVLAAHPGQYVRRDAIRQAALDMPPGEFLRAYGNVWTLTADRVIADHAWRACLDRQLPPPDPGAVTLTFDVAVDRSVAAIGGRWDVAGQPAVDVLDQRAGSSWLVDRIVQLAAKYRAGTTDRPIGYDGAGPALDIADQLERRGLVLRKTTGREYVAACAGFLADVDATRLRHRGSADLDAAVAAAARRELGDGWAWARRQSAGPIAGLVAVTVASWTHDHRPEPVAAPVVVAGRSSTSRPASRALIL